jgi:hypothetical protein
LHVVLTLSAKEPFPKQEHTQANTEQPSNNPAGFIDAESPGGLSTGNIERGKHKWSAPECSNQSKQQSN